MAAIRLQRIVSRALGFCRVSLDFGLSCGTEHCRFHVAGRAELMGGLMSRLNGKIAVVSGAASGIGAAIARTFVGEGADVWLTDVAVDAGEKLAAELGARFAPEEVAAIELFLLEVLAEERHYLGS